MWFRIVSVDRLDSLQQKLRHRGPDPNPELRLKGLPDLRVRTRRKKSMRSSTFWTTTLQPTGMSSYYASIYFGANKKILLLYFNQLWNEQVLILCFNQLCNQQVIIMFKSILQPTGITIFFNCVIFNLIFNLIWL